MATATPHRVTQAPAGSRIRLAGPARRVTLLLHIVAAGAWIGIDVVVAVLVLVGWFADDPQRRAAAYEALGWFVLWPMLGAAVLCLLTGLLLGLGSRWGLVRYWWVLVKLVINLVLTTLVLVALRPLMPDVVDHGRALAAGAPTDFRAQVLFFPPAVSLTALTLASVLAVFKPWGRVRR